MNAIRPWAFVAFEGGKRSLELCEGERTFVRSLLEEGWSGIPCLRCFWLDISFFPLGVLKVVLKGNVGLGPGDWHAANHKVCFASLEASLLVADGSPHTWVIAGGVSGNGRVNVVDSVFSGHPLCFTPEGFCVVSSFRLSSPGQLEGFQGLFSDPRFARVDFESFEAGLGSLV